MSGYSTLSKQLQCHWGEEVCYVAIGCYLRDDRWLGVDQQLPRFLHRYLGTSSSGRARALLIDPCLSRDDVPLCLRLRASVPEDERARPNAYEDLFRCEWDSMHSHDQRSYACGNLMVSFSYEYVLSEKTELVCDLKAYLDALLSRGGKVVIAVFAQPYWLNEDNLASIEMYHELLRRKCVEEPRSATTSKDARRHQPILCILADYACDGRGTRVWRIPDGERYSPDEAVVKQVARYHEFDEDRGIDASIPDYIYMHLHHRCTGALLATTRNSTHLSTTELCDVVQEQALLRIHGIGREAALDTEECYLMEMTC